MTKKLLFTLLIVFGALFIGLSVYMWISDAVYEREGVKTEAIIERIDIDYDDEGEAEHEVFVSFTANGERIYGKLNTYFAGMDEGDTVEIYYLPYSPHDFRYAGAGDSLVNFILLFFGLFMVGFPLYFIISDAVKTSRKKLIKTGRRVLATITDFTVSENAQILSKHPASLTCSDMEGNDYTVKFLLEREEHYLPGETISVYIDEKNPKRYYIDRESYLSATSVSISESAD